jgi:hypothetical protein
VDFLNAGKTPLDLRLLIAALPFWSPIEEQLTRVTRKRAAARERQRRRRARLRVERDALSRSVSQGIFAGVGP